MISMQLNRYIGHSINAIVFIYSYHCIIHYVCICDYCITSI